MKQLFAVLLVLLIGTPPIVAQNISNTQNTGQPIKVEVELVNVYVTVFDKEGGPSTSGLERENFELFEDGKRREILYFGQGDIPLRTCLVADTSGSMMPNIDKAMQSLVRFARMREKNAVVVISDGGENYSRYSENDVLRLAQELEVQIYAIGVYDRARSDLSREEEQGPKLLKGIAEKTGGRVFSVEKADDLARIMAAISSSLKTQYHIQFKPTGAKEKPKEEGSCPDYRKLTVKVKPPKGMPALKVYARRGYCPPA